MRLVIGDILDFPADALLLTIDGTRKGMEGNLARQFARRWEGDWNDIQHFTLYPIPLGKTIAVPWDGDCPWRYVMLSSTLHHLDIISDSDKQTIVRRAFHEALMLCHKFQVRTLSTTILSGGWRLSQTDALAAMCLAWSGLRGSAIASTINVFVKTTDEASHLGCSLTQ